MTASSQNQWDCLKPKHIALYSMQFEPKLIKDMRQMYKCSFYMKYLEKSTALGIIEVSDLIYIKYASKLNISSTANGQLLEQIEFWDS